MSLRMKTSDKSAKGIKDPLLRANLKALAAAHSIPLSALAQVAAKLGEDEMRQAGKDRAISGQRESSESYRENALRLVYKLGQPADGPFREIQRRVAFEPARQAVHAQHDESPAEGLDFQQTPKDFFEIIEIPFIKALQVLPGHHRQSLIDAYGLYSVGFEVKSMATDASTKLKSVPLEVALQGFAEHFERELEIELERKREHQRMIRLAIQVARGEVSLRNGFPRADIQAQDNNPNFSLNWITVKGLGVPETVLADRDALYDWMEG